MLRLVKILVLVLVSMQAAGKSLEDSIYVPLNDSIYQGYKVRYTVIDTVEGRVEAEYADFPGKRAFSANYYNGWRTGVYTSWYPTGEKMEKIIYQKGKKNGEYTRYNLQGEIIIKGMYENDVKNGFWNYRKYYFFGKYRKGKKTGTWRWKQPDVTRKIYFKNGELVRPPTFPITFPRFILMN